MRDQRPTVAGEVIEVCRGLLDDSIPLIDGCRRLSSLSREIDAGEVATFDPFVAVDSETDHLPLGEVRQHCSPDWLKTTDAEIAECERFYRDRIREAAEALLKALTETGKN